MLIWLVVIIVTVFLDQLTKYLTVLHLKPIDTYPLIEDVLHLTYVENTGAAFGMMKNARWVFMITSTLAIIGILGYMIWRAYIKKEKFHWMEGLSLAFIVGGGIGNMIDRTALGYVVDMIDVRLINFAVFNVADSFVCVGAGLMILYVLMISLRDLKEPSSKGYRQVAEQYADELGLGDGEAVDDGEADPHSAATEAEAIDVDGETATDSAGADSESTENTPDTSEDEAHD